MVPSVPEVWPEEVMASSCRPKDRTMQMRCRCSLIPCKQERQGELRETPRLGDQLILVYISIMYRCLGKQGLDPAVSIIDRIQSDNTARADYMPNIQDIYFNTIGLPIFCR